MLYRGMDRARLDAADNNGTSPTAGRRASVSTCIRADRPRSPTLMFIHGGYWQRNDKEGHAFLAEGPLAHGINVALVGYTLAPEARMAGPPG